ncbi:MAG: ABC-F family ATP-binding cassette domain-containing protein [Bacteroidales bacterium]|nr:ABC-F family ATP-binding cassette domain-containing protein [Bacteroidales bacterium]
MFSINNITLEFPGQILFDSIGFVINSRDRIGLVGRNGAGKSTLLKILSNIETGYTGNVSFPKDKTIGYLVQERSFTSKKTVFEEAETAFENINSIISQIDKLNEELSKRTDYNSDDYISLSEKLFEVSEHLNILGGKNYHEQIEKVLKGLGFSREEMQRPMSEFSGGWQMRVELAKLLLQHPDLLLLDEPTNHLDIDSIYWLEVFLKTYQGAVVLVSHDRVLLDNVTTRTIEIQQGKIYDYPMPYSDYEIERQERIEQQSAELKKQQREIAHIEAFIERFRYKATKAKQVQSRIKQLKKLDEINIDVTDNSQIFFKFAPAKESGKIVVEAQQVTKSYGEKLVIKPTDFIIARNDRIAFVGQNGQGKSTLVKMITNQIDYQGDLKIGHNVKIGYFAQNQTELLNKNLTAYETLEEVADSENRPKLRNILGNFLFSGDDINKKVSVLSGGEKTRLAIAKILLEPVNFLILDEPTNHLDMVSKDILKNALLHFNGTLIIVSHDRDFLSGLSTRIFDFQNGNIRLLNLDINELMDLKEAENINLEKSNTQQTEVNNSVSKQKYLESKELEKEKRKIKKEISEIEENIDKIEKEISEIEMQLNNPEKINDVNSYNLLSIRYSECKDLLEKNMCDWENLVKKLNELES